MSEDWRTYTNAARSRCSGRIFDRLWTSSYSRAGRRRTTQEDLERQLALLLAIRDKLSAAHSSANRILEGRKQVEAAAARAKAAGVAEVVAPAARALEGTLTELLDQLAQMKMRAGSRRKLGRYILSLTHPDGRTKASPPSWIWIPLIASTPPPLPPASTWRAYSGCAERVALRVFRPPRRADVVLRAGAPAFVAASGVHGAVTDRAGRWRASGDWWDVALAGGGVYRIFRDRLREAWFVEGELD